jgi:hypothetical protein
LQGALCIAFFQKLTCEAQSLRDDGRRAFRVDGRRRWTILRRGVARRDGEILVVALIRFPELG